MPFLAHADAQPATCLLLVLQMLKPSSTPGTAAAPDASLQGLKKRLCTHAVAGGAQQFMVPQVFSTVLEMLKVKFACMAWVL